MALFYVTNSCVDTFSIVLNGYQLKLDLLGAGYRPKLIYSKEIKSERALGSVGYSVETEPATSGTLQVQIRVLSPTLYSLTF